MAMLAQSELGDKAQTTLQMTPDLEPTWGVDIRNDLRVGTNYWLSCYVFVPGFGYI